MASLNPTTYLADSLAAFSKAAHQAFADVESRARVEIALATSEARQTREERDAALKSLRECQLEERAWKDEALVCKGALKECEMTVAHQADVIAQLQREVIQWKDQSRNWQDHFLRTEQEKCRLSSRIDELLSRQLLEASRITAGVSKFSEVSTPQRNQPNAIRPSASGSRPPAYQSMLPQADGDSDDQSVTPAAERIDRNEILNSATPLLNTQLGPIPVSHDPIKKRSRAGQPRNQGQTLAQPALTQPSQRNAITQKVVRRVQAVIKVPMKEEDLEEDLNDSREGSEAASVSVSSESRSVQAMSLHARGSGSSVKKKRRITNGNNESRAESNENDISPFDDDEDRDDEEDDELMMGAEENKELYGSDRTMVHSIIKSNNLTKKIESPKRRRATGTSTWKKPPGKTVKA